MPDRRLVQDALKAIGEPHRKMLHEHYTIQSDVGRRASLIANDEKYQVWLDHLHALRDALIGRIDAQVKDVAEGPDLGDALAAKKIALAGQRGELRGLQIAIDLIPRMIDAGTRADEMLTEPSSGRTTN